MILGPSLTSSLSEQGTLSPDGSCKTFSSAADGYARGEGVVSIYVKPLRDALRDRNPVRGVVIGAATNSDGRSVGLGFATPNSAAQEVLIRRAYRVAGIGEAEVAKTGFFECHGTGTPVGDFAETSAIARVFEGTDGIFIGSVKPNLGHGEAVSGLTALLKAVMALEHRTIPPNIKYLPLNKRIPFDKARLMIPKEATPWPQGRHERVSLNSFGVGGANVHVIIDSAASLGIARENGQRSLADEPQLMVYSANSAQSLRDMVQEYQGFIQSAPASLSLADLAYTLSQRREHLPFRTFTVGTRHRPGTSAPPASPKKGGPLVMIFSGQGSQWPQMGRELLQSNAVFHRSIKSLSSYLKDLGSDSPDWDLESELLKPIRTSRINEARLSQPLTTALQIALVDTWASIGVQPEAVIGHSSGEIAAAYAAGCLTAEEAIAVAFYRGSISDTQQRPGAMAAVGLSWEQAKKHLIPGVVLACDNSPSSVTLSGDTEQLDVVLSTIKGAHEDVLAKMLKVDKAYHSHHMVEIGHKYHNAMASSGVKGKPPSTPFFSTVKGRLLKTTDSSPEALGPRYWQENLESPVRFTLAVSSLLDDLPSSNDEPIFLEIGPHSTLSGPLRQILEYRSREVCYIPTITRKQNSVEGFLNATGRLWKYHVSIDFEALIPVGTCLPSLPSYPWNHQRRYWSEYRVSRELRMQENPYHNLLGVRVPEASGIEPVWRNIFHINNTPWIRDHKINDDIVFPFACYVCMAAEAVRQVTGIQEGIELRHVVVNSALVLSEDSPRELITTLRRHRLTDTLDSHWWEFIISSYNEHTWVKHCVGQICGITKTSLGVYGASDNVSLPRNANGLSWYQRLRRGGLDYGFHFTSLEDIRTSTSGKRGLATANMRNGWHGDESDYHLHPVILDASIQLMTPAMFHGLTHTWRQFIPSSMEAMSISRCESEQLSLSVSCQPVGRGAVGEGLCAANGAVILSVSGMRLSPLVTDLDVNFETSLPLMARKEWVSHVDFQDFSALVKSTRSYGPYLAKLSELTDIAIVLSDRSLSVSNVESRHGYMQMYRAWLGEHASRASEPVDLVNLAKRMDTLATSLSQSPVSPIAQAISKVYANIPSVVTGTLESLGILHAGDTLNRVYKFMREYDAYDFFRCLAHTKPNLRVLELGRDAGTSTAEILKSLKRDDGQALYSQYVYTDTIPGMLAVAKEHLKGMPNLEFMTLDISEDPVIQGFQEKQFDLIIAADAIHMTPKLSSGLKNAHRLLYPDGRLLLQQPRTELAWAKYVLGILPSWWRAAEDDRPSEPYVSTRRWEDELVAAGFRGIEGISLDPPEPLHLSTVMLTRPRQKSTSSKQVTIVYDEENSFRSTPLAEILEARDFQVSCCGIDTASASSIEIGDVISLVDREQPYIHDITADSFGYLKELLECLGRSKSGMLWVTKPSQTHCNDPRYASVFGLARTVRVEMGIDFAVCETDDMTSSSGLQTVADIFCQFHKRDHDASTDFEYSITENVVRVNRFFPFSVPRDIPVSRDAFQEVSLRVDQPGRLGSFHWVTQPPATPKAYEVEIEVYAVGLNFRVSP